MSEKEKVAAFDPDTFSWPDEKYLIQPTISNEEKESLSHEIKKDINIDLEKLKLEIKILESKLFWYKEAYHTLMISLEENVDNKTFEKIYKRHFELYDVELDKAENKLQPLPDMPEE